jgi:hypothetical protein
MKRNQRFAGAILSAALAVFVTAGIARSEEKHSAAPPQGGSTLSMARFYGGSSARIGDYAGKLVCLRCDLKGGVDAMAQCEKEGHHHALSMDSDSMIHPLLPGTDKVLKKINSGELHGKEVTAHGNYYPATGAILVDRISAAK